MTKKKPEEIDFYEQQAKNEFAFREMLKSVKPDMYVVFDLLEQTGINVLIVLKILRQLNNIATGNGYGTVSINIENGKALFVRGEESDRVNELVITNKRKK